MTKKYLKGSDFDFVRSSVLVGGGTVDSWNKQRIPSPQEILKACQRVLQACVDLNANAISEASLKLRLYRTGKPITGLKSKRISRSTREALVAQGKIPRSSTIAVDEVMEHPLIDLIWRPNPVMGQTELFKYTAAFCDTLGSSYWQIAFNGGTPSELWVLPSQYVTPNKATGSQFIESFDYAGDPNNKKSIPPEEVVSFGHLNLFDPYAGYGTSPVLAVWQSILMENKLLATENAILDNEGRISGIVSVLDGFPGLDAQKRFEAQWDSKYLGAGNGSLFFTDGTTTFTPVNYSPKDLAVLSVASKVEKDICRVMGIPFALLEGVAANNASVLAARQQHIKDAILPRLRMIEDRLNHSLIPLFDENLWFAFDDPSPENQELKQAQLNGYVQNEIITINEARAEIDYAPIPEGERFGGPYNQSPEIRGGAATSDVATEEPVLSQEDITFALDLITRRDAGEVTDETLSFLLIASGWEQAKASALIATLPEIKEPEPTPPVDEPSPDEPPTDQNNLEQDAKPTEGDTAGKALLPVEVKAASNGRYRVGQPEDKHGAKLTEIVAGYFKKQRSSILGGLHKSFERQKALGKSAELPRQFVPLESWTKDLAKASQPVIEILFEDSGKTLLQRVGASPDVFDVFNPKVADEAKRLALAFADSTNATTTKRINDALNALRESLAESLTEGERLDALTERVKEIFSGLEDNHAETIARTEASRSYIMGAKEAARDSGVVRGMKWILAPEPCPICEEIAASFPDPIDLDDDFGTRDGVDNDEYATVVSPPAHPNCFCDLEMILDIRA